MEAEESSQAPALSGSKTCRDDEASGPLKRARNWDDQQREDLHGSESDDDEVFSAYRKRLRDDDGYSSCGSSERPQDESDDAFSSRASSPESSSSSL